MFVNFNILNQLGSPAINSNTFANRPAAGQTGRLFVSTDTYEIYRDNGTTWDLIGGPGSSTITGTGTATQVAYFTSSQAIGSSANLFWDNTNTRLGVGTAAPGYTIEANGDILAEAIYLDGATAGNGALYWISDRVTLANYNAAGIIHIETNGGGLAAMFGADYTATFTSGIGTRGYTGSTSYGALFNGSVGINTTTPGAALDVHSTGTIAQFNTTSATGNTYIAFQRTGTGLWRVGDTYNGGNNFFELHNTVLGVDAMEFEAATNKSTFQAQQTYTTGLARGNYFDFNLSVAAGGSFSSPNAITALGASLDLTLAGNATIPSGARSGLDAYNSIAFTGAGTLTHNQGTQIRAYSNVTAGWAFNGSAVGTITHLAGLRALFPDNSGSAVNVTNNYALLLNDQTSNTGTVTYTNRWGVYQEGASDLNYMAANLLLGSTSNNGLKLQVTGQGYFSGNVGIGVIPSAWRTSEKVLQIGQATSLYDVFGITILGNNYYTNTSSQSIYLTNGYATYYWQNKSDGSHSWNVAPSGTAGNVVTFTPAMNLNASGILLVGQTSVFTTAKVQVGGANSTTSANSIFAVQKANEGYGIYFGVIGSGTSWIQSSNGDETARYPLSLQPNGANVLIGTTTDAGQKLQVAGQIYSTGVNVPFYGTSADSNGTILQLQTTFGTSYTWGFNSYTNGYLYFQAGATNAAYLTRTGDLEIIGNFKTGAPSGGTAAAWKLGSRVAATVVVNTNEYIEIDIGGTLYKLATVT